MSSEIVGTRAVCAGTVGAVMVLAHLSDIHIDGSARSAERATRVMSYLNALPGPLDAILVTGDIADHGLPAEYTEARSILKSRYPVLTCPGNHDVRAAYRALLDQPADDTPVNTVHRIGDAMFAMCDSSIPGEHQGHLSDETIAWLDGELSANPDIPTFVCFHHPPVLLHAPGIDAIRQFGTDRLADLITAHPQVAGVLCGHAHTAAASTFAGRPLLVAPGVVSTIRLPWEHDPSVTWSIDLDVAPSIAFHVYDSGRLTTHYRVVPAME